jgi:hypothetical protein
MITELPSRIDTLLVGSAVLKRSRELLEPFRARKVEGCLLWFGYVLDNDTCVVTTCVKPTQASYATTYTISAEAVREVRRHVRPHRLMLLVQIHTHPKDAYFSQWDEEHALNKRPGALNMIVPDHGNIRWIETERFCIVERTGAERWEPWSKQDWSRRLVIVPDALVSASL